MEFFTQRIVDWTLNININIQAELDTMDSGVNDFVNQKGGSGNKGQAHLEGNNMENDNKDCLMFHGVAKDDMEEGSGDDEIKKNFLDHNIKKLLLNEWGIECSALFKHIFR